MARILGDCRDLAIHRLLLSFSALLDRVGDMLMDRASRTDVREEQAVCLDARDALQQGKRPALMAEFERRLRAQVDDRIAGKIDAEGRLREGRRDKLTLVDTHAMDESVVTGNITRVVENLCHDELQLLNRGIGHLLGQPDLETDRNPFAPAAIVDAFAEALQTIKAESRSQVRDPEGAEPGVARRRSTASTPISTSTCRTCASCPPASTGSIVNRGSAGGAARQAARAPRRPTARAAAECAERAAAGGSRRDGAVPPHVRRARRCRRAGAGRVRPGGRRRRRAAGMRRGRLGMPGGARHADAGAGALDGRRQPAISRRSTMDGAGMRYIPSGRWRRRRRATSRARRSWRRRCWARASRGCRRAKPDFDLGGGTFVQFSGIPEGKHNVLRDLQESPLGKKANQLESMTIELVAMLFDFIFETKDLPDGIKALLARLQIPVLKAAMLDGAFFAKKNHPSRLLVNALAEAGRGWSPVMGHERPALQPHRRDRPPDPRRLHRRPRDLRRGCARSSSGSSPRRRRRPRRTSSRPPRRSTRHDRQGDRGGRREVRDRAAHRDVPGPELPRVVPAPALDRRRWRTST